MGYYVVGYEIVGVLYNKVVNVLRRVFLDGEYSFKPDVFLVLERFIYRGFVIVIHGRGQG